MFTHDQRTVFGRTLRKIADECGIPRIQFPTKSLVKKRMKFAPVPASEAWRPGLLKNLLMIRRDREALPGFSAAEVDEMIEFVCTS